MPISKNCVVCGSLFSVPPCRAETATTCSNECAIVIRAKSRERKEVCRCKNCGKSFNAPRSHASRRVYCSMTCKLTGESFLNDISDRMRGEGNPQWSGGETRHKDGYLYILRKDNPLLSSNYMLQHRAVMEDWLREDAPNSIFLVDVDGVKYLAPKYDVHHIDGVKLNNSRSNLLVCTQQTHRLLHAGYGVNAGTFWPERVDIDIDNVSPELRQKERRKLQRKAKQELVNYLLAKHKKEKHHDQLE